MCVRGLDPGSRALLDLSLRRRLPFEAMAGVLHTDPFDLARRRARAVARIAAELDLEGAGVVAIVQGRAGAAARRRLGRAGAGVRRMPARRPVQAEPMAERRAALMTKLREQRRAAYEEALAKAALREQPTVEMDVVRGACLGSRPPRREVVTVSAVARPWSWRGSRSGVGDGASVAERVDGVGASRSPTARWRTVAPQPEPVVEDQPTVETEALRLRRRGGPADRRDRGGCGPTQPVEAVVARAAADRGDADGRRVRAPPRLRRRDRDAASCRRWPRRSQPRRARPPRRSLPRRQSQAAPDPARRRSLTARRRAAIEAHGRAAARPRRAAIGLRGDRPPAAPLAAQLAPRGVARRATVLIRPFRRSLTVDGAVGRRGPPDIGRPR